MNPAIRPTNPVFIVQARRLKSKHFGVVFYDEQSVRKSLASLWPREARWGPDLTDSSSYPHVFKQDDEGVWQDVTLAIFDPGDRPVWE